MPALALLAVSALTLAVPHRAPRQFRVSDFEGGLGGWWTNDAVLHAREATRTTLITIDRVGREDAKGHCLRIDFHPGDGWANAAVNFTDEGDRWADAGVDEVRLQVRGDGSDKQVRMGFQAWADDLVTPVMFELPVSLSSKQWRPLVLRCADLEASLPGRRLRLRSLISFQVNGSGALGPASVWIDDVAVANAHGQGARFAESPLASQVTALPAVKRLPRLGNWAYPGRDAEALRQCKELGIAFSSNGDSALQQQRVFLEGIVTSHSPGRPSGSELIDGLGLGTEDMDQDASGRRSNEGVESAAFHPGALKRFEEFVRSRVRARADAPWVASFVLSSPISMYGEVHYPASDAGRYLVFGRAAQANFRAWLRRAYRSDLAALSQAWGATIGSWDYVRPPDGPTPDPSGVDTRRSWSDFMHWYNAWLEQVSERSLKVARAETRKPLALMLGGPKIGLNQGICLGNIGPIARMLGRHRPAFLNDTDSQTLFSCRYTRAACSQYGVDLMVEHVGPPHLQAFHQVNTAHNAVACGSDFVHLATLGELFDPKHWFHAIWRDLAPVVRRYRTGYVRSDAAMFHSYLTSWYRWDRSNGDCVRLYDASNTLWFWDKGYPSWGRALGSPDIVDDAMVEDGGLAGRKLLVIPNSGATLTSRKAANAIRSWVQSGGRLIAFGRGCLEYAIEPDRSLARVPYVAGMLRAEEVESAAPDAVLERRVGKGSVVWFASAANPDSGLVHDVMPRLVAEADGSGVRRWARIEPGFDANLMYAGRDRGTNRHLFVLDLTKRARNGAEPQEFWSGRQFRLSFHPELHGDAELVAITDSFRSCKGAAASWSPSTRVLTLRFSLPTSIEVDV